jgi:transcriptional regulator with XRE-family HTH domain
MRDDLITKRLHEWFADKPEKAIAVDLGVDQATVNRWKHGSIPKHAMLSRIAAWFKKPVEQFYEEITPPKGRTAVTQTTEYAEAMEEIDWLAHTRNNPRRYRLVSFELTPETVAKIDNAPKLLGDRITRRLKQRDLDSLYKVKVDVRGAVVSILPRTMGRAPSAPRADRRISRRQS